MEKEKFVKILFDEILKEAHPINSFRVVSQEETKCCLEEMHYNLEDEDLIFLGINTFSVTSDGGFRFELKVKSSEEEVEGILKFHIRFTGNTARIYMSL